MCSFSNFSALFSIFLFAGCNATNFNQEFVMEDIPHFWEAYDSINNTTDTILQAKFLQDLFLDRGTEGLDNIMKARRYTDDQYLDAIKSYPNYWESVRANTLNAKSHLPKIEQNIRKLNMTYPDLVHAPIYFTLGVFRTNGTARNGSVLIGSEMALAGEDVVIDELPEWRKPFYAEYKPLQNIALLCTHEYIHTQQNDIVEELITMCLYEGIAEYLSCMVTDTPSNSPAIQFGKNNEQMVKDKFVEDLFTGRNNYNWMWGQNRNELKIRDLGYYVGYEISERYYNQAPDKVKAVKDLIELDFKDFDAVARIVDASGFLPKPLSTLKEEFDDNRPVVSKIVEFDNGSQDVDPNTNTITVIFSKKMVNTKTGLDFGPLGKEYYPNVDNTTRKFGEDNLSYSFEVSLQPNTQYQMTVTNFRSEDGGSLHPYVINFKTKE